MKNNRGQTIVIFVVFLPILILFLTYVYDVVNANYEKTRIKNLATIAIDTEDDIEGIKDIIKKNDKDINITVINESDKYKIKLVKRVESIFGKIVGRDYYEVTVFTEK